MGSLPTEMFVDVLEANALTEALNDQEILTLLRRFSDDGGSAVLGHSQSMSATNNSAPVSARNNSQKSGKNSTASLPAPGQSPESAIVPATAGDIVYYMELNDLLSHLYYMYQIRGRVHQSTSNNVFSQFLSNARSRTVQWRRVFRKDPSIGSEVMQASLAYVVKVFQKNGITLTESIVQEIAKRYALLGDNKVSGRSIM